MYYGGFLFNFSGRLQQIVLSIYCLQDVAGCQDAPMRVEF
jgi:hypothetical protein